MKKILIYSLLLIFFINFFSFVELISDVKSQEAPETEWTNHFGGLDVEYMGENSLIQTSDGGYALAGVTMSYGGQDGDFWLVKIGPSGNMLWNRTFGGPYWDAAWAIVENNDGGFTFAGETFSFGSQGDFWLVRTNSIGNLQWSKAYGLDVLTEDRAYCLIRTNDGGYALVGDTMSMSPPLWEVEFHNGSEIELAVLDADPDVHLVGQVTLSSVH